MSWDPAGPTWEAYVSDLAEAFPEVSEFVGSPWDIHYHNAMEATLQALEAVDGDLSDGHEAFRDALAKAELDAPNGHIELDQRRQAIGSSFVTQVQLDDEDSMVMRTLRRVDNVEQTFNGYFTPDSPPPGPDQPQCKQGNPPPWAVADGS